MIVFGMHLLTALGGIALAVVMVVKIVRFPDAFNRIERWGMALVGGTMILRAPSIMVSPETTPFSDWATMAMTGGLLMMTAGRMVRLFRHSRVNTRAVDAAETHLRARGKL